MKIDYRDYNLDELLESEDHFRCRANNSLKLVQKGKICEIKTKRGLAKIWSPKDTVDSDVYKNIINLIKLKDIFPYIAVMPDFHINGNLLNGVVIPSRNTLYVDAIGGDIGCGISSLEIPIRSESISENLKKIYDQIYCFVPCGKMVNRNIEDRISNLSLFKYKSQIMTNSVIKTAKEQLGSLGGGNHFIELQKREDGNLNLMVHSGSRHLGQVIRTVYQKKGGIEADSEEGQKYLNDMNFAVKYAKENRKEIIRRCYEAIKDSVAEIPEFETVVQKLIDVPHNYISKENHFGENVYVHRKGAICIPKETFGIIPGSMGTDSYIVRGVGSKETFNSSSHGAGRKMSRGEALNTISQKEFDKATSHILCRRDQNILDESPQAYKDLMPILKYQNEIVKRAERLTPIMCIKG